jgi:FlaA1/EpsC-like NDP-sugar epimerase
MQDVFAQRIIGREGPGLLDADLRAHDAELRERIGSARFLVIGGAGAIGQALVKEIVARRPRACHAVDLSENNLAELVRDVRSTFEDVTPDFRAIPIDYASLEFARFFESEPPYDYVLNLSALKHVRSEKDVYSLMRMIDTNVLNAEVLIGRVADRGGRKYFTASTDKAANPVNMMGATKSLMEYVLYAASSRLPVSTARFANVAFSDGSLLDGFRRRIEKRQPIAAPVDVRRYIITLPEAGQLCLTSCLLGNNRDTFFPKLNEREHLISFRGVVERFLKAHGYAVAECASEREAIRSVESLAAKGRWPCYFFTSDTTGEKPEEEFHTAAETLDMDRFEGIGVVVNPRMPDPARAVRFREAIQGYKAKPRWSKAEVVEIIRQAVPNLEYEDKGRNLDQRM